MYPETICSPMTNTFRRNRGQRGSVRGPYGVLLHSPKLAARVAHTGSYVRFDFDIPEALKEVIIIATAREIRNQYEFAAHARLARGHGVTEETIVAIARGAAPKVWPAMKRWWSST